MPSEHCYDAIVIGGGPAGSTAAYHLAKGGVRVLLLEREERPHHKVCGEFLSGEALPLLAEMGISLEDLGAVPITGAALHSRRFHHSLPLEPPAFGLSRLRLDEALLQNAAASGVEVRRGVVVDHFEFLPERQVYGVRAGEESFQTRALFLATGKHELKSAPPRKGKEKTALGFKIHVKLSASTREKLASRVELFFFRGGYAGLCAVEAGRVNLCLILDKNIFKSLGGHFDGVWEYLQRENPALRKYLAEAQPEWSKPLSIANLPYGHIHRPGAHLERDATGENFYLLGDQFAVIASFTGAGMTIALRSGRQAAVDFLGVQGGQKSEYSQGMRKLLNPAMRLSYPLHACFRSPWLADACVGLVRLVPRLADFGWKRTRIAVPE